MIYEYKCQEHGNVDIYKSASLIDREELCETCKKPMVRLFIPTTNINPGAAAFRGEFNYGLGAHFNSKSEIKNHLAKIEGETGKKIVEVGSDRMDNVKPKRKKVNDEEAVRELRHRLTHG